MDKVTKWLREYPRLDHRYQTVIQAHLRNPAGTFIFRMNRFLGGGHYVAFFHIISILLKEHYQYEIPVYNAKNFKKAGFLLKSNPDGYKRISDDTIELQFGRSAEVVPIPWGQPAINMLAAVMVMNQLPGRRPVQAANYSFPSQSVLEEDAANKSMVQQEDTGQVFEDMDMYSLDVPAAIPRKVYGAEKSNVFGADSRFFEEPGEKQKRFEQTGQGGFGIGYGGGYPERYEMLASKNAPLYQPFEEIKENAQPSYWNFPQQTKSMFKGEQGIPMDLDGYDFEAMTTPPSHPFNPGSGGTKFTRYPKSETEEPAIPVASTYVYPFQPPPPQPLLGFTHPSFPYYLSPGGRGFLTVKTQSHPFFDLATKTATEIYHAWKDNNPDLWYCHPHRMFLQNGRDDRGYRIFASLCSLLMLGGRESIITIQKQLADFEEMLRRYPQIRKAIPDEMWLAIYNGDPPRYYEGPSEINYDDPIVTNRMNAALLQRDLREIPQANEALNWEQDLAIRREKDRVEIPGIQPNIPGVSPDYKKLKGFPAEELPEVNEWDLSAIDSAFDRSLLVDRSSQGLFLFSRPKPKPDPPPTPIIPAPVRRITEENVVHRSSYPEIIERASQLDKDQFLTLIKEEEEEEQEYEALDESVSSAPVEQSLPRLVLTNGNLYESIHNLWQTVHGLRQETDEMTDQQVAYYQIQIENQLQEYRDQYQELVAQLAENDEQLRAWPIFIKDTTLDQAQMHLALAEFDAKLREYQQNMYSLTQVWQVLEGIEHNLEIDPNLLAEEIQTYQEHDVTDAMNYSLSMARLEEITQRSIEVAQSLIEPEEIPEDMYVSPPSIDVSDYTELEDLYRALDSVDTSHPKKEICLSLQRECVQAIEAQRKVQSHIAESQTKDIPMQSRETETDFEDRLVAQLRLELENIKAEAQATALKERAQEELNPGQRISLPKIQILTEEQITVITKGKLAKVSPLVLEKCVDVSIGAPLARTLLEYSTQTTTQDFAEVATQWDSAVESIGIGTEISMKVAQTMTDHSSTSVDIQADLLDETRAKLERANEELAVQLSDITQEKSEYLTKLSKQEAELQLQQTKLETALSDLAKLSQTMKTEKAEQASFYEENQKTKDTLTAEVESLQAKLTALTKSGVASSETENTLRMEIKNKTEACHTLSTLAATRLKDTQALEETKQILESKVKDGELKIAALQSAKHFQTLELEQARVQLEHTIQECEVKKSRVQSQEEKLKEMEQTIKEMKNSFDVLSSKYNFSTSTIEELRRNLASSDSALEAAKKMQAVMTEEDQKYRISLANAVTTEETLQKLQREYEQLTGTSAQNIEMMNRTKQEILVLLEEKKKMVIEATTFEAESKALYSQISRLENDREKLMAQREAAKADFTKAIRLTTSAFNTIRAEFGYQPLVLEDNLSYEAILTKLVQQTAVDFKGSIEKQTAEIKQAQIALTNEQYQNRTTLNQLRTDYELQLKSANDARAAEIQTQLIQLESTYKQREDELQTKLHQSYQELDNVKQQAQAVSLKITEAENELKKSRENFTLQNAAYYTLQAQLQAVEGAKGDIATTLQTKIEALRILEESEVNSKAEIRSLKQTIENINAEMKTARNEILAKTREIQDLTEANRNLQAQKERIQMEKDEIFIVNNQLKLQVEGQMRDIDGLTREKVRLEENIAKVTQQLSEETKKLGEENYTLTESYKEKLSTLNQSLDELNKTLSTKSAKIRELENQKAQLQEDNRTLKSSAVQFELEQQRLNSELVIRKGQFDSISNMNSELTLQLNDARKSLATANMAAEQKQGDIEVLTRQINNLKTRQVELENSLREIENLGRGSQEKIATQTADIRRINEELKESRMLVDQKDQERLAALNTIASLKQKHEQSIQTLRIAQSNEISTIREEQNGVIDALKKQVQQYLNIQNQLTAAEKNEAYWREQLNAEQEGERKLFAEFQISKSVDAKASLARYMNSLKEEIGELQAKRSEFEAQKKKVLELKESVVVLQLEAQKYKAKAERAEEQYQTAESEAEAQRLLVIANKRQMREVQEKAATLEENLREIGRQLAAAKQELIAKDQDAELISQLTVLQETNRTLNSRLMREGALLSEYKAQAHKAQTLLAQATGSLQTSMQSELSGFEDELKAVNEKLTQERLKVQELEDTNAKNQMIINATALKTRSLEATIRTLEEDLNTLRLSLSTQKQALSLTATSDEVSRDALLSKIRTLETEIQSKEIDQQNLSTELATLKVRFEQMRDDNAALQNEISTLTLRLKANEEELAKSQEIKIQLESALQKNVVLEERLVTLGDMPMISPEQAAKISGKDEGDRAAKERKADEIRKAEESKKKCDRIRDTKRKAVKQMTEGAIPPKVLVPSDQSDMLRRVKNGYAILQSLPEEEKYTLVAISKLAESFMSAEDISTMVDLMKNGYTPHLELKTITVDSALLTPRDIAFILFCKLDNVVANFYTHNIAKIYETVIRIIHPELDVLRMMGSEIYLEVMNIASKYNKFTVNIPQINEAEFDWDKAEEEAEEDAWTGRIPESAIIGGLNKILCMPWKRTPYELSDATKLQLYALYKRYKNKNPEITNLLRVFIQQTQYMADNGFCFHLTDSLNDAHLGRLKQLQKDNTPRQITNDATPYIEPELVAVENPAAVEVDDEAIPEEREDAKVIIVGAQV